MLPPLTTTLNDLFSFSRTNIRSENCFSTKLTTVHCLTFICPTFFYLQKMTSLLACGLPDPSLSNIAIILSLTFKHSVLTNYKN